MNSILETYHEILHTVDPQEELDISLKLLRAYEKEFPEWQEWSGFHPEKLKTMGGQALSGKHAIECIGDGPRTARFMKGVFGAVEAIKGRIGDAPIRILYAGTGPFAPLVIPMILAEETRSYDVDFIEFHPPSYDVLNHLMDRLRLDDKSYVRFRSFCADATDIDLADKRYDLIVSETMFRALYDEPQVAIFVHLKKYLDEGGFFIPEQVDLALYQHLYKKIPQYKLLQTAANAVFDDATGQQLFFSLNADFEVRENPGGSIYTSKWIPLGPFDPEKPDLCIETRVKIWGDQQLSPSESVLTNPKCIASRGNWPSKKFIRLSYQLEPAPHWTYELK